MVGLAARIALGLSLAVLSAGCAWWERPAITSAAPLRASMDAAAPTLALAPSLPARSSLQGAISNAPEGFVCVRIALARDTEAITVQRGDTLALLAIRLYGDRMRAMDIARANDIENPDLILVGQVLRLPPMERGCRRSLFEAASYVADDGARPLSRRAFSPPSARQPDQQRVRATATDP